MSAGLQVWGDHGFIQIDENYRNLVMRSKGTKGVGDGVVNFANGVAPVLVIYSNIAVEGKVAIVKNLSVSGTTYTWTVNGACDWYVFDAGPVPASSGAGLQVFNATGQLVFDSNFPGLRVVGVFDHTPGTNQADNSVQIGTLAGKSSRKIGFIQSRPAFYNENQGPGPGGANFVGVGIEGVYMPLGTTSVFARKNNIVYFQSTVSNNIRQQGQAIAVDVTGL